MFRISDFDVCIFADTPEGEAAAIDSARKLRENECETCQDCGVVEVDVPCDARCEWATGQHHTVEVDCPCCSEDAWEDKE